MLFQKLSKAKNANMAQPRHNLGIFSQLRDQDGVHSDSSLSEDDILQHLDQELFRDAKHFQSHETQKHTIQAEPLLDISEFTPYPSTQQESSIFGGEAPSPQNPGKHFNSASVFDNTPKSTAKTTMDTFGGIEGRHQNKSPQTTNKATFGDYHHGFSNQKSEVSNFSVYSNFGHNSEEKPRPGVAQFAPKLNAQTLFAFGPDAFSTAFTQNQSALADNLSLRQQPQDPWSMNTPDIIMLKQRGVEVGTQENRMLEEINLRPKTLFQSKRDSSAKKTASETAEDSDVSDNSNITDQALTRGLSACLSTDQSPERSPANVSQNQAVSFERNFFADTTNSQDNSFVSQTKSDIIPAFKPSAGLVNHTQQPYQFMVDQDVNMPHTMSFQMGSQAPMQQPFNMVYQAPQAPQAFQSIELTPEEYKMVADVDYLVFDQQGCRLLQKKLEDLTGDYLLAFTSELVANMLDIIPEVMINQFGNYLSQRIIEVCASSDIKKIVHAITPNIVEVSMDSHGTRVVQALIDILGNDSGNYHNELIAIIQELEPCIFDMITHVNGNHVVQQFLLVFRASEKPGDADIKGTAAFAPYTNFIFNSCIMYCDLIASDKHGCCVMQRCLEKGLLCQKLSLSEVIINQMEFLIEDQFGNYLVQNVIKLNNETMNANIINFIAGDFIRLSQLKFSSNVIEKCLETKEAPVTFDQIFRGIHLWDDRTLIQKLGPASRDQSVRIHAIVSELVTHIFGNYVLQKTIGIVDQQLRIQILESIKKLSHSLQQTKHGQKVLQKLTKLHPETFGKGASSGANQGQQKTTRTPQKNNRGRRQNQGAKQQSGQKI